jgi:hypothetical protein
MGARHQTRPQCKTSQASLHSDPHALAMASEPMPQSPSDEDYSRPAAESRGIKNCPERRDSDQNSPNCYGMPECDWNKGQEYDHPTLAMEAKRNSEQPSHGWVHPMECAETCHRDPGPEVGRQRSHG